MINNKYSLSPYIFLLLGTVLFYVLIPILSWIVFVKSVPRYPNTIVTEETYLPHFNFYKLADTMLSSYGGTTQYLTTTDSPSQVKDWYERLNWHDHCLECGGNVNSIFDLDFGFLVIVNLRSVFVYEEEMPTTIRITTEIYIHVINGWLTTMLIVLPELFLYFMFFKRQAVRFQSKDKYKASQ